MNKQYLIKFFEEKRKNFPILKQKVHDKPLIYADNSATTQKPQVVIDSIVDYYSNYNSNVHRGIHALSERATEKYENVRGKVADFINCNEDEVVFTKGTTESLNMVAFGLADEINEGDEIVVSQMEHHADIVPWQEIAKRKGAAIKFIPYTKNFRLDLKKAEELITNKTKVVSLTHCSNVLGVVNPVEEIGKLAKEAGAYFVVDGAQSIAHMEIDVKKIDCDFFAFSAHKMCGPTGVGVLYGKKESLEKLTPYQYGGDMIDEVGFECSTYAPLPHRLEAGTPNIEGVIAIVVAIDYLKEIGMKKIEDYEKILCEYFLENVKKVDGIEIYGPMDCKNRSAVFSFNIKGIHSHDMSTILDRDAIAIRGGHHCAMPLIGLLEISAVSRISLYFYNTLKEIDYIIEALKKSKGIFDKGEFLFD